MKHSLLFLVLLHLAQCLYAQHKIELKIEDPDHNVIPGVTIEYGKITYYTDLNGMVNVDINNKDTLSMTHIAFEKLVLYPHTLQDNRQRTLFLTLRHKYVNLPEVSVSGDNMINTLAEACGKINMPLTAYQAEVIQMVADSALVRKNTNAMVEVLFSKNLKYPIKADKKEEKEVSVYLIKKKKDYSTLGETNLKYEFSLQDLVLYVLSMQETLRRQELLGDLRRRVKVNETEKEWIFTIDSVNRTKISMCKWIVDKKTKSLASFTSIVKKTTGKHWAYSEYSAIYTWNQGISRLESAICQNNLRIRNRWIKSFLSVNLQKEIGEHREGTLITQKDYSEIK